VVHKDSFVSTPVLPITGQEFPLYLVGILIAVFENSHSIEICALLWYHAACGGSSLPTFRDILSGLVFKGQAIPEDDLLTLEDGTDRLSRNVGNDLPLCAA